MTIQEILQDIYTRNGALTPTLVVEEARDENHPLHEHLEWDDSLAAEKHRLDQARQLIRTVRVVELSGDKAIERVRAFHSVPRPTGHTYVPIGEVRADPFTRQLVLMQAEREWRSMYARYQHLTEFLQMVKETVSASA